MPNSNLNDIFKEFKNKKTIRVIEKLAGTNPKCVSLFFDCFGNKLEYLAVNLIDQTETYMQRAKKIADDLKFNFNDFKSSIYYLGGINIAKTKLSASIDKCDIVIYWQGGLGCIRQFSGSKEENYKKIVAEEYAKSKSKKEDNSLIVHQMIRNRLKTELPSESNILEEDLLEEILKDDLSCLSKKGVIITNTVYDYNRAKPIMNKLGRKPNFYNTITRMLTFRKYESAITVWRR